MAQIRISRLTLINSILAALVAGMIFSPLIYSGIRDAISGVSQTQADPLSANDQHAALELQQSFINIYKKASPSVVFIKTNVLVRSGFWLDLYRQQEQAGSGFVIDREGHIVTNNHVVAGARKIEVIFSDNSTQTARLVGRDEASDVAVIRVAASERLVPALLGDSDKVEVGQLAFALGAPFGLDRTFTVGSISAKARRIDSTQFSRIQTDASINPGNSGGPLLNVFGQVIGINQSIYSTSGGNVGIGFAIPINEAKSVIERLKREQRVIGTPTLGVQVGAPAAALRQDLGVGQREGVIVIQVLPGSAAADAGLQEYDFIYSVNNKPVRSPEDLVGEVQRVGVDGKLELKIMRNKHDLTLQATVGESLDE
ncbi:MAG: trypsin-like peptidase domain-containing protein [Leptospirales bacterium]|nr:trypsin-like peptidase domain-containing protein [Leptospirales bacterium]